MCDVKDAKRHVALARLQENKQKAREHYLEATSIYVLNAELLKKTVLLDDANRCYKESEKVIGKNPKNNYSKQELAKLSLEELKKLNQKKQDLFEEIDGILV